MRQSVSPMSADCRERLRGASLGRVGERFERFKLLYCQLGQVDLGAVDFNDHRARCGRWLPEYGVDLHEDRMKARSLFVRKIRFLSKPTLEERSMIIELRQPALVFGQIEGSVKRTRLCQLLARDRRFTWRAGFNVGVLARMVRRP